MDSLAASIEQQAGVYWSRSRGQLWRKGETSGATQTLLGIKADCDSDTLRFTVRQHGSGFCHLGSETCWGDQRGLAALERILQQRLADPPEGSYTNRLANDPSLLASKLAEEIGELIDADGAEQVIHEASDVLYFTLVRMLGAGVSLADVERELDRRARKVTRRPGNAKEVQNP
jgi:phosphoribosyl-ATP pyrophosphohydrolase